MGDTVENRLTAFAITPSRAASRPMNTTRPDQINRLPIDPVSPVFMSAANLDGC